MESLAHAKDTQDVAQKNKTKTTAKEAAVYAAIDLGTNNCRLLIASPIYSDGSLWPELKVLDSYSRIVRLGEGLSGGGALSEEAMGRTLKALRTCENKLKKFPEAHLRFVATEACRRSSNGAAFIAEVKSETGMSIEIIDNEQEAELAFYGCCSLLDDKAKKALTFDIGGGSTEFMWADRSQADELPEVLGWASIPYGVMNLSEQFGGTSFAEVYFDEIVGKIAGKLAEFDAEHNIRTAVETEEVQLLSTSGTVTTLAAIHLELSRYDRSKIDGICLKLDDLRQSTERLMAMTPSERYQHPCVGSQRADYIISGCAILEAIHRTWPFAKITIADRGVREGIIMSMILSEKAGQ